MGKHKPKQTEAAKLASSLDWEEARGRTGFTAQHEGHIIKILQDDNGWDVTEDCDRACTILFLGGPRDTGKPWPAGYKGRLFNRDHVQSEDAFFETFLEEYEEERGKAFEGDGETLASRAGFIWDSLSVSQDQTAFAYVTKESRIKEWGKGPQAVKKAKAYLKAILKELQQVSEGDVWGFQIAGPVSDDSCWGFVGLEYAKEAAIEALLGDIEREEREQKACQAITRL